MTTDQKTLRRWLPGWTVIPHEDGCAALMNGSVEIKRLVAASAELTCELENARELDARDTHGCLRREFNMPQNADGEELVYVCGSSLGPQPKLHNAIMQQEMECWSRNGVNGHLDNPSGENWVTMDEALLEDMRVLVGATDASEVALASGLTTNLHNLMVAFYLPTAERFRIITDAMSFPTDYFALESQVKLHGLDPREALIEVAPRDAKTRIIEDDDIVEAIGKHGASTALIMISGVHYLTGQVFDMRRIARAGREAGCLVAFDLAHAIGNVPLQLHEWDVDFAVWCTYKYLNSGPGSVGGLFVHRKHHCDIVAGKRPLLAGWWGVDLATRFLMKHEFQPYEGARAFQQSCTSVFGLCGVRASMHVFRQTDPETIRRRSHVLTEYFRNLFRDECNSHVFEVMTPREESRSGAQISLAFPTGDAASAAFQRLSALGIVADRREPDIVRLTFTGLYNTHEDVFLTAQALKCLHT